MSPLASASMHRKMSSSTHTTASLSPAGASNNSFIKGDLIPLQSSRQRSQQNRIDDSLHTANNKLQFDRLPGLFGRDTELTTLQDCLQRLSSPEIIHNEFDEDQENLKAFHENMGIPAEASRPTTLTKAPLSAKTIRSLDDGTIGSKRQIRRRRELVFISGESGTGKSTLAQALKKHVKASKGIFCTGKYDAPNHHHPQQQEQCTSSSATTLPFAGLSLACRQICDEILELQRSHQGFFFEIQDKIKTNIGMVNIDILSIMMPQIYDLIGENNNDATLNDNNSNHGSRKSGIFAPYRRPFDAVQHLETTTGPRSNSIDQSSRTVNSSTDNSFDGRPRQRMIGASASSRSRDSSLDRMDVRRKSRRSSIQAMGDDTKQERLEAALKVFFKFVSQEFAPVVIVLDDLQWADPASLKMLETLMIKDLLNTELMIIGCIRTEDIGDAEALTQVVESAVETSTDLNTFTFTQIEIGNISMSAMEELLSELLSKNRDEVKGLAQLCVSRTGGNILHTREYLSMLVREGFLKFHVGTFQWDWNIDVIEHETEAAPSIVGMVQNRMKQMQPELMEFLTVAACLGHTFSRETLQLLWEYRCSTEQETRLFSDNDAEKSRLHHSSVDSLLGDAVQEACLVPLVQNITEACLTFQFVHDQIKESVLSLTPKEELQRLRYLIGRLLLDCLAQSDLEAMFLVVVNLINSAETGEDITIAKVNLQAASQALRLGAFSSASAFAVNGISHLPEKDSWKYTPGLFDLAMDLHALGAQAAASIGNFEEAEQLCEVILAEDGASPMQKCAVHKVSLQKCAAYKVQITSMHYQKAWNPNAPKSALEMNLDILSTLGVEVPRNKWVRKRRAMKYVEQTKGRLAELSKFESMPAVMDPIELEKINLLEKAGSAAFTISDSDLYIMLRCLFVDANRSGLTELSGTGLSSFSAVLAHQCGDFETALKVAKLSLKMQRTLPRYFEARTIFTANFYVLGWVQPLRKIPRQLLQSYESAICSGNTESVSSAVFLFLWTEFLASERVDLLHQDFEIYVNQMTTFLQSDIRATVLKPIWQLCKNLLGLAENTTLISGEIFDEVDAMKEPNPLLAGTFPRTKSFACMFFAEYEKGADLVAEIGGSKFLKKFPGAGFGMEYLPFGVCCYAAAGKCKDRRKKRQYRKMADQIRKDVAGYVKKGCVNLVHILSLLNAEHYALNRKQKQAAECYQQATLEAARGGYVYSSAVANERYADFLIEKNNEDEALYRLTQSKKCYEEWGAKQVARRVAARRSKLKLLGTLEA